jgi:hypothetical protein
MSCEILVHGAIVNWLSGVRNAEIHKSEGQANMSS